MNAISIVDKYTVKFYKKVWSEDEIFTAQCLDMTYSEGYVIVDIRLTWRKSVGKFMKYVFSTLFFKNAAYMTKAQKAIRKLYDDEFNSFKSIYGSRLDYSKVDRQLRNYQIETIYRCVYSRRKLLALDMGTGKTITSATISRVISAMRTAVIGPAIAKWNWYGDMTENWGFNQMNWTILEANRRKTMRAIKERFVVLNYEIIEKYQDYVNKDVIDHFIIDECFTYDTLVMTDRGPLKIGEIVENKIKCKALSLCSSTNVLSLQPITKFYKNDKRGAIIKISCSGGYDFTCTGRHKIYVEGKGYKRADEILPGEELCTLREYISFGEGEKQVLWNFMLSQVENETAGDYKEIPNEGASKKSIGSYKTLAQGEPSCSERSFNKNVKGQSHVRSREYRENASKTNWKKIQRKRGERKDFQTSNDAKRGFASSSLRICSKNKRNKRFCEGGSQPLQDRFSLSGINVSNRSGRKWTQAKEKHREGREEKSIIRTSRVESIEVLELGSRRESSAMCGSDYVYDIQVENNHNYFANGVLVSNCHRAKNTSTKTFKGLSATVKKHPKAKITLLTGTPITNRVTDLFAYLKLCGHPLGKNKKAFEDRYAVKTRSKIIGVKNVDELNLRLSNFMIRLKSDDVLELPKLTISRAFFNIGDLDNEYNEIIMEMKRMREEYDKMTEQERKSFKIMSQINSSISSLSRIAAMSKIDEVFDWAKSMNELGEKVVIFSSFTGPLIELEKKFGESCVRVDGSVKTEDKMNVVNRFKKEEGITVFLGQVRAAGEVINLQNARTIMLIDVPVSPKDIEQPIKRCHRGGQERPVFAYFAIAKGTIDERLYALIKNKTGDINSIVDVDTKRGVIDYGDLPELLFKELTD